MADLTSVQEQFKEMKEQQLVAREAAREVEIKNQGRVFDIIELGKMLAGSDTLFLEEPSADYHLCDIRCQAIHSLGPLSSKTS